MSEEALLITGITADIVAGKTIDAEAVAAGIENVDLVIAHNAKFDRPMLKKHWDCCYSAGKLDYLGMQFGWFYNGHRGRADCEACLAL